MPSTKSSKWQKKKKSICHKFKAVEKTREQTNEFWAELRWPKVKPIQRKPKKKEKKVPRPMKCYGETIERDHGMCQFPGCNERNGASLHHIKFRSQGGKNDIENLVTLCRKHHTGNDSPHMSSAWRRYWEGWAEEKYPQYWTDIRESNKIRVGGL